MWEGGVLNYVGFANVGNGTTSYDVIRRSCVQHHQNGQNDSFPGLNRAVYNIMRGRHHVTSCVMYRVRILNVVRLFYTLLTATCAFAASAVMRGAYVFGASCVTLDLRAGFTHFSNELLAGMAAIRGTTASRLLNHAMAAFFSGTGLSGPTRQLH